MSFAEKLAAAKSAPRPTATVKVCLDNPVSEKRRLLLEQLEEAKKPRSDGRLSEASEVPDLEAQIEALEVEFAGALVEIRFERMLGQEWSELTMTNPARPGVILDQMVGGYNVHAVTRAAAVRSAVVVDDGSVEHLSEAQWDDLFDTVSGAEFNDIVNTVYTLNQGAPEQAIELAGKALAAIRDSERTSQPQSDSE